MKLEPQPESSAQPRPTTSVGFAAELATCVGELFGNPFQAGLESFGELDSENVSWFAASGSCSPQDQGQKSNDEWDLWLTCRHMFCKNCSTEMLRLVGSSRPASCACSVLSNECGVGALARRRMPCPLCRRASTVVQRGHQVLQAVSMN